MSFQTKSGIKYNQKSYMKKYLILVILIGITVLLSEAVFSITIPIIIEVNNEVGEIIMNQTNLSLNQSSYQEINYTIEENGTLIENITEDMLEDRPDEIIKDNPEETSEEELEEIIIEIPEQKIENTTAFLGERISFEISSSPSFSEPNKEIKIKVTAKNPTEENLEFDVWSYVYRSSKCISDNGNREYNKKTINFHEQSKVTTDLTNIIDKNAKPGEYFIKVKIDRSDRKTLIELKEFIEIIDNSKSSNQSEQSIQETKQYFELKNKKQEDNNDTKLPKNIIDEDDMDEIYKEFSRIQNSSSFNNKEIYLEPAEETIEILNALNQSKDEEDLINSSSEKSKKLLPFILIVALILISVILAFKKL